MPNSYPKPEGITRLVFFEFTLADRLKVQNVSNQAQTGGGARDLRFNYERMEPALVKMFPNVRSEPRRRGGSMTPTQVRYGNLFYMNKGAREREEMKFEPPTSAREREGRIPTLHRLPPLNNLPPDNEGATFLILLQLNNDEVEAHYVTEESLKGWHEDVRQPILNSLARRRGNNRVNGFLDYTTGNEYLP